MRCLVVILSVVACARVSLAAAGVTCVLSEEFFLRHNVTADDNEEPGPICGGQCCGRGSEVKLRSSLRKVVDTSTVASTKWTAELLLSTRRSLQDHLTRLSQLSQNKTATFFTQVYRGHASRTVRPLAALYDDIRIVLRSTPEINGTSDSLHIEIPKDLAVSAKRFFRDIFPVAYHNMLKLDSKQFTPEYEACLKDAYEAVLPFGDIPQQLGSSLSRSLETARALLQMLAEGAEVLATTDQVLLSASDACSERLLRLAGCSRCHGHTVLPCKNYCLNVARGCIGSLLVELNHPWAGYVEAVERLTKVDADVALRELETKVSNAIMYAIENTAVSENKVRQECGPASTIEPSGSSLSHPSPGMIRREYLRAPPPDTELLQFAATLATTKNLFGDLADRLCDQPDFSVEDTLDNCWNGNAVADYSKPLVKLESLSDQKYNPEIGEHPPEDRRVAILADRLQQAKQLLISYSRRNEAPAESFMQGDEAGEEGSGSGRNYPDDYDTDTEGSGDDGSGDSDGQSRSSLNESPPDSSTPRTSGSHAFHPAQHALLLAIIYTALTHTT